MSKTLQLSAPITLQAGSKPRRLSITAYTGATMTPSGWGPTVVDLAGVKLPAAVPILADHQNELASIIGTGKPEIRGGKLTVTASLANSEAARHVIALLESGTPLQSSIGLKPLQTKVVRAGELIAVNGRTIVAPEGGLSLVVKGQLKEVSVVALGADDSTSVSLAARRTAPQKKERTMEGFHEWLKANNFDPASLEDGQRDALLKAFTAENLQASGGDVGELRAARAAEREKVASKWRRIAPGKDAIVNMLHAAADDEDWTASRLDLQAYRECAVQVDNRPRGVQRGKGGDSNTVLRAALWMHCGLTAAAEKELGADVCERARDLNVTSVADWCRASLQAQGRDVPRGQDELIRAASGPSTISLPNALGDTANRALLDGYNAVPASWRSWVARRPVKDFRTHNAIRLLSGKGLERVAPGGELKHSTLGDENYPHSADTFGRLLTLDRRDIINDDLGVVAEVPRLLGLEGARKIADLIYAELLSNPSNFFGTAHGNFNDGSDSVLASGSLELAIAAFRKQVDAAGRPIDVPPSVLCVPPELEFTARRLLNSTLVDRTAASEDLAPTGNALVGMLALEVEPRLSNAGFTGNSTTAWYLFGAPNLLPTGIASFLNGVENPTVRTIDPPADYLGLSLQVVFDAGFNLADYRGGYLAAGA